MIDINMSDVISVIESCRWYLIALAVILVIAIITSIVCRKANIVLRGLIRKEAAIVAIAAIAVIANLICFGPMSTLLTLSLGGSGTISAETTEQTNTDVETIAGEGTVLLKNDGGLPLESGKAVNVFGWTGANPVYGGSGAGALNDLYDRVTLVEGLENAGLSVNQDLIDFYGSYDLARGDYGADWTLPEPPVADYDQALLDSAREFSDTALFVIGRIGGEGSDLPTDMSTAPHEENSTEYADFEAGEHYLQLSHTERDVLDMLCTDYENVIVIYDGLSPMEMGFVDEYPQIKAALWCAGPGQTGFNALGEILAGSINPSGKTPDTFVYDLTTTPTFNNIGNFPYDNMDEFMVDKSDPYMGGAVPTFVNYVEGIYAGYRFYETAAAEGAIDYDGVVQYPFGYGLSYTTFEQTLGEPSDNGDGTVSFDVTVTNTGDVAGKDVAEIYYNPPYTDGGIEKASANLIDFAKTDLLDPGDSQTLSFTIDEEDMASYDQSGDGHYVLEAGDYVISLNSDSHTVIDSFIHHVDEDIVYDEGNPRSTDQVAATNRFGFAAGDVTYLSRADHFANMGEALAAPSSMTMSDELKAGFINTSTYQEETDADAAMPTTGANNGMTLADLRGADYDDPQWDALLDQLTIDDMQDMIAHGGFQTAAAPSVGKAGTVDVDGPSALSNNFTGAGSVGFPSAVMIAATWNPDMADAYGSDMGAMADQLGASGWYAPSMNLHRSAFEGRSYEYFSEDGLLSGVMASRAVAGAAEHGVYAYLKHFALNEQETNRWSMLLLVDPGAAAARAVPEAVRDVRQGGRCHCGDVVVQLHRQRVGRRLPGAAHRRAARRMGLPRFRGHRLLRRRLLHERRSDDCGRRRHLPVDVRHRHELRLERRQPGVRELHARSLP